MGDSTNVLKFTDVYHILPINGHAAAKFIFYYSINDQQFEKGSNTITVTITDVMCLNWGFPFWSYNPSVDFKELVKVLMELVKERIRNKLADNSLIENEKLAITSNHYYHECPFNPDELEDLISIGCQFHPNSISMVE